MASPAEESTVISKVLLPWPRMLLESVMRTRLSCGTRANLSKGEKRERERERYIYIYAVKLKTGPRFGVL